MKMRNVLFCLILLVFPLPGCFSQIVVTPTGRVGLGLGNTNPQCSVDILGNTAIRPNATNAYLKIYSDPTYGWIMNSSLQYTGYIGYYGYLYALEAKYVYCSNLNPSD